MEELHLAHSLFSVPLPQEWFVSRRDPRDQNGSAARLPHGTPRFKTVLEQTALPRAPRSYLTMSAKSPQAHPSGTRHVPSRRYCRRNALPGMRVIPIYKSWRWSEWHWLAYSRNALPGMRMIPILPQYYNFCQISPLSLRRACECISWSQQGQACLYKSALFSIKSICFLRDPPLARLLRKRLTKGGSRARPTPGPPARGR